MGKHTRGRVGVTIGIDVSDKHSQVCVLDEAGEKIEEGRIPTTESAFRKRFEGCPTARIAMETGTHSPWMSRLLAECGHEVIVANAHRVRAIYENDSKDDRVDAETLARLGRTDPKLLYPIQHRGKEAQADLAVLRAREMLVQSRTKLVNHVRGAVKSMGQRLPSCSTPAFARSVRERIPTEILPAISPLLETIEHLNRSIQEYDRCIEAMAKKKYPETEALQQVPGVGPLTATAYVLTLEDPRRFRKSRSVGAYLGLRTRRDDSGESRKELRITKSGDGFLRRLLVHCAHYILGRFGPDTDLRRWGRKLEERGGKTAKKKAITAVARKLAVLLHRLWVSGDTYEPLRKIQARKAG